ncbi:MAG: response regulator [Chitinophagaceae bacterium]
MLKTLIIDDEVRSRSVLRAMISKYCANIFIAGEAATIEDAILLISEHDPDLVFLDVELGLGTGFDLLGQLPEIRFKTIFITAYDHFAIKAIKWSAQDYLLKPLDPQELIAAVNKLTVTSAHVQNLPAPKSDSGEVNGKRIGLPMMDGLVFFDIGQIVCCEAKGAYTECSFTDNKKILVSKPLQVYEAILLQHGFFRVHHSFLINLACVKEYIRGRGGVVVMIDGSNIPVASRKRDEFLKHLLH